MKNSRTFFTILIFFLLSKSFFLNAQSALLGMTEKGGDGLGVIFKTDANGGNERVDYTFTPNIPGHTPNSSMIKASNGKLYGVTRGGGATGTGGIFEYDASTNLYTSLFYFGGSNGQSGVSIMQASNGKLYGMTYRGGANGAGVIFEFDYVSLAYKVKYDFPDLTNGSPGGSLIEVENGKLYGITGSGGYIFEYNYINNIYTQKYPLKNGNNGIYAYGSLLKASNGKLYGLTSDGGAYSSGVIFEYNYINNTYTKKIDLKDTLGTDPQNSLIQASNGKLYGMTKLGGKYDKGVIFEYDYSNNSYNKLINFIDSIGSGPVGNLTEASNGKLYGIAYSGGKYNSGTLFEYNINTKMYSKKFDFISDSGYYCTGSLIEDSNQKLYGMTSLGGVTGYGGIFEFDYTKVIYSTKISFATGSDGIQPHGSLMQNSQGKLYGMTYIGGAENGGVIFEYNDSTGNYSKKLDFTYATGYHPNGDLMEAANGKAYGLTYSGGASNAGVIFEYDFATNTYSKKIDLYLGKIPMASLIEVSNGKLYGTTSKGGANDMGIIFEYNYLSNIFTKKIDMDSANGSTPYCSLLMATNGKLYGTTYSGGANNSGVIFEYDWNTNTYVKKIDLNVNIGTRPHGSLIQANNGKLYGLGSAGTTKNGSIFEFDYTNNTCLSRFNFTDSLGALPLGTLMQASNGRLYGMTFMRGKYDFGTLFEYDYNTFEFTKKLDFDGYNGARPTYGHLMELCVSTKSNISISACNSYTSPSGRYNWNQSGTYFDTLNYTKNCNKILTISLTINKSSLQNNSITACNSYTSPSRKYVWTTSGLYQDTVSNSKGCDSIFAINLTIEKKSNAVINAISCNNYISPSSKYSWTESGTYKDTIPNSAGCDSIITINLTIKSTNSRVSATTCNSYISPSGKYTWTTSGTYNDTITNSASCDSVITFNLTINSTNSSSNTTACNNFTSPSGKYTWTTNGTYNDTITNSASCDSVITINLIIENSSSSNISATACNSYTSPSGKYTWTITGTYNDTIPNIATCDSVITVSLIIKTIDTSVVKSGMTLTANATGASYQWLDCNNSFTSINGETNQSYTASTNGNYAVELNSNGCKDTSVCTVVTLTCFAHYTVTKYDTLQNNFTLVVDSLTTAFANSYHWDFGDGNTSTLATPSHTFTVDTVYNVCLKIKTASNDSCAYCHIIGKDYLGNIYRMSGFTINVINPNLQTGVSSILSNENSFIVFPNPTSGETEIIFNQTMNNISIKVLNTTGQTIINKIGVSGNRFNIDIAHQAAGVYFIEVLSGEGIWRGKLVRE